MAKQNKTSPSSAAERGKSTPLQEPVGGWPRDQYTGKPGSYVRDPHTGLRRPADEPQPTAERAAGGDTSTT